MKELDHLYYSKKSDNEKVRKIEIALEKGSSIQSLYKMEIEKDSVDKILLFLHEKENNLYDDDGMDFDEWLNVVTQREDSYDISLGNASLR